MDFGDNEGSLILSEAERDNKVEHLTISEKSSFSGE